MAPVTALWKAEHLANAGWRPSPELGMEAMHELEVRDFPVIIASARGTSVY